MTAQIQNPKIVRPCSVDLATTSTKALILRQFCCTIFKDRYLTQDGTTKTNRKNK